MNFSHSITAKHLDWFITCGKEGDDLQVGELVHVDLHLAGRADELLDLADGGGHLTDALGRELLLRDGGLEVTHQGRQNTLEVHGGGALGHAQDEDVGPGVANEGDLSLVAAKKIRVLILIILTQN